MAFWAHKMDRTLHDRSDELEKLIKAVASQVETLHDVASQSLSFAKEVDARLRDMGVALATLSEQAGASDLSGQTPDTPQEPALVAEGVGGVSTRDETAKQIRPLDIAAARSLFARLRKEGTVDAPGVTQLRLNWVGRSEEASNSDPPHIFRTVRQVGDFVAFSSDLRTGLLFPNPEAGETSADLEFVFPVVKQGDFENALENVMPLQVALRDDGSWLSVE